MWTKGLNSKTHGKFPNQLAKSWTPVNSAADLLFWGWWNGDPGKLISMAGWKMDVWRMYFPWGCFGPLVVLVYRSVPDLLFKLITWPFVKTKKNLQIRFTIEKKTQLLGNLFAIFLGGMELIPFHHLSRRFWHLNILRPEGRCCHAGLEVSLWTWICYSSMQMGKVKPKIFGPKWWLNMVMNPMVESIPTKWVSKFGKDARMPKIASDLSYPSPLSPPPNCFFGHHLITKMCQLSHTHLPTWMSQEVRING